MGTNLSLLFWLSNLKACSNSKTINRTAEEEKKTINGMAPNK